MIILFTSKKEIESLKKDIKNLSITVDRLTDLVLVQQDEINELKKPKEPEYFG